MTFWIVTLKTKTEITLFICKQLRLSSILVFVMKIDWRGLRNVISLLPEFGMHYESLCFCLMKLSLKGSKKCLYRCTLFSLTCLLYSELKDNMTVNVRHSVEMASLHQQSGIKVSSLVKRFKQFKHFKFSTVQQLYIDIAKNLLNKAQQQRNASSVEDDHPN